MGEDVPLCMDCKMDREEEQMDQEGAKLAKISIEIRRTIVIGFEMEGPSKGFLINQANEIFREGLSVEQIRELPAVVSCATWEGDDKNSEIDFFDEHGENIGWNA